MAFLDKNLLRLLPPVLRARDFHLYLEGGKRLTDLWRWGGKAVLGHKPPRVLVELKNAAERGLFAPFPHPLEKRLYKALAAFFPGRAFRLYRDESALRRALKEAGLIAADSAPFYDPAIPSAESEKTRVSLWRPFLEPANQPFQVPVLPFPAGPVALVLDKSGEDSFPPGEIIPPVLLAPAARALYNLAAKRGGPDYPKIRKALAAAEPGGGLWQRRGIYLAPEQDITRENYETLFRRFLDSGFLIPPSPEEPAILPLEMSAGEESKLAELLAAR